MLLQSTQHRALLDALDSCMPFAFSDKETFVRFGQGVKASILSFNFDYASSNVSAFRHMVFMIGKLPLAASHVMLYGERCLTHALHIVKCDGLVSEGISGVLYSLSKIIAHGRSMNGLIAAKGPRSFSSGCPQLYPSTDAGQFIQGVKGGPRA